MYKRWLGKRLLLNNETLTTCTAKTMTTNKRNVQLLAMAQTGKKLESWATEEDKKIYEEMKQADKNMRKSAKKLGIKNPILEIPLEID